VNGIKGLLELSNVVIKQLEIVGDLFFAAYRGRENDDLTAGLPRDTVGVLRSK